MGVRDPAAALHTKEQLRQLIQIISNAVVMDADVDDESTAVDSNSSNSNNNNNNIPLSDWQQLALGGVYVTTELHLLTDQSPNYQDTWEFLHERVSEWERLCWSAGSQDYSASSFLFNPTALLQQGGKVAYTASAVASSLAGGVVSLLQPNVMLSKAASTLNGSTGSGVGTSSFSVPDLMWKALLKVPPPPPFTSPDAGASPPKASDGTGSTGTTDVTSMMDGTDPSHYDSKVEVK
jgi:hypothetical protein